MRPFTTTSLVSGFISYSFQFSGHFRYTRLPIITLIARQVCTPAPCHQLFPLTGTPKGLLPRYLTSFKYLLKCYLLNEAACFSPSCLQPLVISHILLCFLYFPTASIIFSCTTLPWLFTKFSIYFLFFYNVNSRGGG